MGINMKTLKIYLLLSVQLLTAVFAFSQNGNTTKTNSQFFGNKQPGIVPERFILKLVNDDYQFYASPTYNSDLTEICWTPNFNDNFSYGGLVASKFKNGSWTKPYVLRFLDSTYSHRSPFFDYNSRRLYFQAYKNNIQGFDQMEKFYFVEKTSKGWSDPVLLDTIFNKYTVHWQFSLDKQNNLYFGGDLRSKENTGGIYYSECNNGKYLEPVLIFKNTVLDDAVFGPAISPDGDYILFARIHPRESTNPRIFSIYISFKDKNNNWSEPKELGEKLNMMSNQPRITPDGKNIFFIRNSGTPYWVSSKIIEELRPKENPIII
jgi:hypothetical protein